MKRDSDAFIFGPPSKKLNVSEMRNLSLHNLVFLRGGGGGGEWVWRDYTILVGLDCEYNMIRCEYDMKSALGLPKLFGDM